MNPLIEHIIWIQVALVLTLSIPAILIKYKAKRFFHQINQGIDLEQDVQDEKGNHLLLRAMLFNRTYIVLSFIIFGLALDPNNSYIMASILIFIGFIFINIINETQIIRMIQKYDPMKKGDPTSFTFQKDYFASLDEAEKVQVYQAAYHTFSLMELVYVILITIATLAKMAFDLGNGFILSIGLLWFIQSLAYFYYSKKMNKRHFFFSP